MPLGTGLTAHFKLNAASGDEGDSVGSVTLTDNNTVGSGTGVVEGARSFVAANSEYFTGGDVLDAQKDNPRSISVWLNPSNLTGAREIISKKDAAGADGWAVYASGDSGTPAFQLRGQGGRDLIVVSDVALSTSAWQHLVITYEGIYNDPAGVKIYINGAQVAQTTQENGLLVGDTNLNAGTFTVGARSHATPTNFFDGLIDEISIWHGTEFTLTATEVAALYNGGRGAQVEDFSTLLRAGRVPLLGAGR